MKNLSVHESELKKVLGIRNVGVGFWQNGVFGDFFCGPPDFLADFVVGFFLLIFVGKSAQKNPPGKSPAKSSKIYTTKIQRKTKGQQLKGKSVSAKLEEQAAPFECSARLEPEGSGSSSLSTVRLTRKHAS